MNVHWCKQEKKIVCREKLIWKFNLQVECSATVTQVALYVRQCEACGADIQVMMIGFISSICYEIYSPTVEHLFQSSFGALSFHLLLVLESRCASLFLFATLGLMSHFSCCLAAR